MDYAEHDLAGLLAAGVKFSVEESMSIARQLLTGLNYLHLNCIMNRDLKPANLLMTRSGVLKITDFGLAKFFDESRPGRDPSTPTVCTRWSGPSAN